MTPCLCLQCSLEFLQGWPAANWPHLSHKAWLWEARCWDVLLADIRVTFEKLDADNKFPSIFCEANELIRLVLEPVTRRLDNNSSIFGSLTKRVHNLSSIVSAPPPSDLHRHSCTLGSLKGLVEQFLFVTRYLVLPLLLLILLAAHSCSDCSTI